MLAQFATNPVLQRLGQYIGQDHVRFDARSFQPWTSTQPGHQVQQQPFLQHPVPNLAAPQFGFFGQQPQQAPFGQMFGGGSGGGGNNLFPNLIFGNNPAPPQAAAQPNPVPNASSDTLTEHTREWQPVEPVEQCTICLGDMDQGGGPCRQLNLCPHHFHRFFSSSLDRVADLLFYLSSECLNQMLKTSTSPFLQCPICKKVHGVRTGNRPINGTIEIASRN